MSFLSRIKYVTLQVRKKSLSSSTAKKTFLCASQSGSLTVEAALSVTLFVFAVLSMMVPIRIVHIQRQVQAVLESVGEEFSQYAYGNSRGEESPSVFLAAAGSLYIQNRIGEIQDAKGIEQISALGTQLLADGEHIDLRVSYKIKIPFSTWNFSSIPMSARCFKRAWVGKSGLESNTDIKENGEESSKQRQVVYVGSTSYRYHWYADCHYLFNDMETISYQELENRKNKFGRRYQPCDICGKTADKTGNVYIMPGGEKYHTNDVCSSIRAYAQEVFLDEVEILGECSYCAERRGKSE